MKIDETNPAGDGILPMKMDCDKCFAACGAQCCSSVPLPNWIFEKHQPVREITKMIPLGDNMTIPETESGRCPFLGMDLKCTIYEDRPFVCRKFGDESSSLMTCAFQAADGRVRSRQERRQIERKGNKQQTAMIKRLVEGQEMPDKEAKELMDFHQADQNFQKKL